MRELLLSLQEAAGRLGTTVRTVQRLIARGELRVVRLPGVRRTLLDPKDLARLVAAGKRRQGRHGRLSDSAVTSGVRIPRTATLPE